MHKDYLDHLAAVLRCSCLSDLRYRTLTPGEAEKLLGESEEFPLLQYMEAARYILLKPELSFPTAADAKKSIVAHMS